MYRVKYQVLDIKKRHYTSLIRHVALRGARGPTVPPPLFLQKTFFFNSHIKNWIIRELDPDSHFLGRARKKIKVKKQEIHSKIKVTVDFSHYFYHRLGFSQIPKLPFLFFFFLFFGWVWLPHFQNQCYNPTVKLTYREFLGF